MLSFLFVFSILTVSCNRAESTIDQSQSDDRHGIDDPNLPPDDEKTSSIRLEREEHPNLKKLNIVYQKGADAKGPRVAEIRLALSSDLNFVSAGAGDALEEANKELIGQKLEDGTVRLVAFAASNITEIGSGILASVLFESDGNGSSTVGILVDRPLFAPDEANQGLLVDEKITF